MLPAFSGAEGIALPMPQLSLNAAALVEAEAAILRQAH